MRKHEPYLVGLLLSFYRVPRWIVRKIAWYFSAMFVLAFGAIVGIGQFVVVFKLNLGLMADVISGFVMFIILVGYYYTFYWVGEYTTKLDWLGD